MINTDNAIIIPTITNSKNGPSVFCERLVNLSGNSARMLSEQLPAVNFRLRHSDATYSSQWHVAGDPTLLVILKGSLRIHLRDGQVRDFSPGDMFIAEDHLTDNDAFDNNVHGHRAEVFGETPISVLHLKLEKRG